MLASGQSEMVRQFQVIFFFNCALESCIFAVLNNSVLYRQWSSVSFENVLFQEITNIQDEEVALATLESLNWDLQRAIEAQLSSDSGTNASPMELDGPAVIMGSNENSRSSTPPIVPQPLNRYIIPEEFIRPVAYSSSF